MNKHLMFLFLSGLIGSVTMANAGALEQGIKSFEQKDYVQAEKLWQPLAKKGDVRAQFNLALALQKKVHKKGQKKLQKDNVMKYLTMSKAGGLVDGYFITLSWSPSYIESAETAGKAKHSPPIPPPPSKAELKTTDLEVIDVMDWLNQQQQKNYTLQLATGKSKQHLEVMQKKLSSSDSLEQPDNLYVQAISKKGKTNTSVRYILIYGVFETYQKAKDQVSKLPESLQKSSPWIRPFGDLQSIAHVKQEKISQAEQP